MQSPKNLNFSNLILASLFLHVITVLVVCTHFCSFPKTLNLLGGWCSLNEKKYTRPCGTLCCQWPHAVHGDRAFPWRVSHQLPCPTCHSLPIFPGLQPKPDHEIIISSLILHQRAGLGTQHRHVSNSKTRGSCEEFLASPAAFRH